jgi:hypothetical protein
MIIVGLNKQVNLNESVKSLFLQYKWQQRHLL